LLLGDEERSWKNVNDIMMHLLELSTQGFFCSQILQMFMLQAEGKDNPDLIRSMGG